LEEEFPVSEQDLFLVVDDVTSTVDQVSLGIDSALPSITEECFKLVVGHLFCSFVGNNFFRLAVLVKLPHDRLNSV
jgi:hypothetical protein